MHTFKHKEVIIRHNGDYSGDATITVQKTPRQAVKIYVPCEALRAFAFDWARNELEQMELITDQARKSRDRLYFRVEELEKKLGVAQRAADHAQDLKRELEKAQERIRELEDMVR